MAVNIYVVGRSGNFWMSDDDGVSWAQITTGLSDDIVCITGLSPLDVYFSTAASGQTAKIYHFDGSTISLAYDTGLTSWNASDIKILPNGDICAGFETAGNERFAKRVSGTWSLTVNSTIFSRARLTWDGSKWIHKGWGPDANEHKIWEIGGSYDSSFTDADGWCFGANYDFDSGIAYLAVGSSKRLYYGNWGSWNYVSGPSYFDNDTTGNRARQLCVLSSGKVWVGGTYSIFECTTSAITEHLYTVTGYAYNVHGTDDNNVWAIRTWSSSNHIAKYDGASWSSFTTIGSFFPNAIWTQGREDMPKMQVKTGAFYLDNVRLDTSSANPVIANRIPPPANDAQLDSGNSETYNIEPDSKLRVDTPTSAEVECSNAEPYNLSDGDTLIIAADSAMLQTISLSGLTSGSATAGEVATSIFDNLRYARPYLSTNATKITLRSNTYGASSKIRVVGGTARTVLGFDDTEHAGADHEENVTFTSTQGYEETSNSAPYVVNNGDTLFVSVDGGGAQTVTLAGITDGAATAPEIAYTIASQLTSATADVSSAYLKVTITSDLYGTNSSIQITGGTAQAGLGFDGAIHNGTGDFADMTQATALEVKAVLNAQLTRAVATTTAADTKLRLTTEYEALSVPITDSDATAHTVFSFPTTTAVRAYSTADKDTLIAFDVFDLGTNGITSVTVDVTRISGKQRVYDSTGPTVHADWYVTKTERYSPGASAEDTWNIVCSLKNSIYFASTDIVTVEINASTADPSSASATYQFKIEDWKRPKVIVGEILNLSSRTLRLHFTEPMNQTEDALTSTTYTQDVSGGLAYYSSITIGTTTYQNVIEAPAGGFTASHVGLFAGSYFARHSANNGSFEIIERLSSSYIRVDHDLIDEEPADLSEDMAPPSLFISPYRLIYTPPDLPTVQPAFIPIPISAEVPSSEVLNPSSPATEYIDITFHDDLTPGVTYTIELAKITDLAGNVISSEYTFDSWQLPSIDNREFDLWDFIPQFNKDQDSSKDLERLIRCMNEVCQLLLYESDLFGAIKDPYKCKASILDSMLDHLGNPFSFVHSLSEQKKRDLIPILIQIYKYKGTATGMENAVLFFIGKAIEVLPDYIPQETWELGISELGRNTYVGPSASSIRYSFYVKHTLPLTDDEKTIITEIIEFMRPAHTHFQRYSYEP